MLRSQEDTYIVIFPLRLSRVDEEARAGAEVVAIVCAFNGDSSR